MAGKKLVLRRPGNCAECKVPLAVGASAWWEPSAKSVTCMRCRGEDIDLGTAGASARREGVRRASKRQQDVRAAHPRLGGFILALTDDPQSTKAWERGSEGERQLGAALSKLGEVGLGVLHDRKIPGSKANVDHLVVAPSAIYVIDAKRYAGKLEMRNVGGWLRPDERLYVAGRDRSKLIDGVQRQAELVSQALRKAVSDGATPVWRVAHPVLCFIDTEWDLFASPIRIGPTTITWPRALMKRMREVADPAQADAIQRLTNVLSNAFPRA